MLSATPSFFAARAGGAANDWKSPKVHRRESCLASVHIKPVSPPRHAEFCAFFISVTALPLPFFRLTSLRVCAGTVTLIFILKERLSSLGYHH
jgi:hypothetical protein